MNDIFSIKRFSASFRRLITEKGIKMFGSILILLFLTVLFMNVQFDVSFYMNIREFFVIMGLMFGPILYTAVVANEFTSQSKGISYLLMPSSSFEKWLLNNIVVIALYYIVYGGLFRLIELWMIGRLKAEYLLSDEMLQPLAFNSGIFIVSILIGVIVSLGILLGSHYFKKNSLIFSLFILFGLTVFVFFADFAIANYVFDGLIEFGNTAPFSSVYVIDPSTAAGEYLLMVPLSIKELSMSIFLPIILLLSVTNFVRIREKQL